MPRHRVRPTGDAAMRYPHFLAVADYLDRFCGTTSGPGLSGFGPGTGGPRGSGSGSGGGSLGSETWITTVAGPFNLIRSTCSSFPIIDSSSALGKSDPFLLTKSDPHREQDLPPGKSACALSSTPQACGLPFHHPRQLACKVLILREDIRALVKSINHLRAAEPGSHVICPVANTALPGGKSATASAW
jgi:hypothetical protein